MDAGARIVVVHGIGQQFEGEDTLLQVWLPGLRDGLRRTEPKLAKADLPGPGDVGCAFYGDLFRPAGTKAGLGLPPYDALDIKDSFERELLDQDRADLDLLRDELRRRLSAWLTSPERTSADVFVLYHSRHGEIVVDEHDLLARWRRSPGNLTSRAGSGKSAVLARLVTFSDSDYCERVPLDGVIDVALHLRKKTLGQICALLAKATGCTQAEPKLLVNELLRRPGRLLIVADALDEATQPEAIVDQLLRPLADGALAGSGGVRLLVAARPEFARPRPGGGDHRLGRPWLHRRA